MKNWTRSLKDNETSLIIRYMLRPCCRYNGCKVHVFEGKDGRAYVSHLEHNEYCEDKWKQLKTLKTTCHD